MAFHVNRLLRRKIYSLFPVFFGPGGATVSCITSSGRTVDIGLQLDKAFYPCSR